MDLAIAALNDTLSYALGESGSSRAGAIVVLHPFGRHLDFNLPLLVTEGGFDRSTQLSHEKYIPFRAMDERGSIKS